MACVVNIPDEALFKHWCSSIGSAIVDTGSGQLRVRVDFDSKDTQDGWLVGDLDNGRRCLCKRRNEYKGLVVREDEGCSEDLVSDWKFWSS